MCSCINLCRNFSVDTTFSEGIKPLLVNALGKRSLAANSASIHSSLSSLVSQRKCRVFDPVNMLNLLSSALLARTEDAYNAAIFRKHYNNFITWIQYIWRDNIGYNNDQTSWSWNHNPSYFLPMVNSYAPVMLHWLPCCEWTAALLWSLADQCMVDEKKSACGPHGYSANTGDSLGLLEN